jgi:hypothetical protein
VVGRNDKVHAESLRADEACGHSAQLMVDYGIGVSEMQTYTIYRIDSDYFSEE